MKNLSKENRKKLLNLAIRWILIVGVIWLMIKFMLSITLFTVLIIVGLLLLKNMIRFALNLVYLLIKIAVFIIILCLLIF